jgi:membrane-anchored mycosin MYCP
VLPRSRRLGSLVLCAAALSATGFAAPALAAPTAKSSPAHRAGASASKASATVAPGPAVPEPPANYVNTTQCVRAANAGATLRNGVSWAQTQLDYLSLWTLGKRGKGQTIAVIDTGVNPVSAFGHRLEAGGDFVVRNGSGLDDCDGHGTVVAGLIAASPDPKSGFAGVAPDATLISIRQSSSYYGVRNAKQGASDNVAGNTESLAQAIVFAVHSGAKIINISEASCRSGSQPEDPGSLAVEAAVRLAIANGVVVVAAAGNVDSSKDCKTQNTPGTAAATIPVPADIPGVLAVGAVDRNGDPAAFSLAGSWVDVAAPGTDIVSTDPVSGTTGQINRFVTSSGVSPIQGTSFAAPYVAGLVALVRARFPGLDPAQVIARITRTAIHPAAPGGRNDYVGYGMIDPQAALTAVLPGEAGPSPSPRSGPQTLPVAHPVPDRERHARLIALLGSLGLLVVVIVAIIVLSTRRRRAEALAGRSPRPRSAPLHGAAGGGGRRR